ncbi:MAG TPA: hypothetical protein VEG63_09620 [Candidatus Acidoferrales bacterium]|nr:hypothetical protein [Candidatus Acidoferrales bacterium]
MDLHPKHRAPAGSRARSERGGAGLKFLVVLIILILLGYAGFQIVPPYVNNYQLQDSCVSESRLLAAHQKTEEKVRETVWATVQSLNVPIKQDDIKVEIIGKTARVSIQYAITVNLFGFDYTMNFNPAGESPIF